MSTRLSKKLVSKTFWPNNNEIVDDNSKTNQIVVNLSKNNKSKNLTHMPCIKTMKKSTFLIPNAKKILNHLRQIFIKATIF